MTDRDKLIEAMAAALADEEGLRPTEHSRRWVRQAKAVLTAIEANGLVVVPREPTEAMIEAGEDQEWRMHVETVLGTDRWRRVYRAMLAAAPLPDAPMQGDG
jgi:hypothetical protein